MADSFAHALGTLQRDRERVRFQLAALRQAHPADRTDYESERSRLLLRLANYDMAITIAEQIGGAMLRAAWSSRAAITSESEASEASSAPDLDALFCDWQASRNKADFISALPLDTARQLLDYILAQTPRTKV